MYYDLVAITLSNCLLRCEHFMKLYDQAFGDYRQISIPVSEETNCSEI